MLVFLLHHAYHFIYALPILMLIFQEKFFKLRKTLLSNKHGSDSESSSTIYKTDRERERGRDLGILPSI